MTNVNYAAEIFYITIFFVSISEKMFISPVGVVDARQELEEGGGEPCEHDLGVPDAGPGQRGDGREGQPYERYDC